jgi:hypothetical protein
VRADEEMTPACVDSWSWLTRLAIPIVTCVALAGPLASTAHSQASADRGELRGLKLGLAAQALKLKGFGEIACGSNGGAPRQPLDGWTAFGKCRAEDNGLHEVYVHFDDEGEYIGRAVDDPAYARGKGGTRIAGHPVILSVLFDRDGIVRALRFVTDPRAASHERRMAHLLRLAVFNRYDHEGWTCTEFPPAVGETAVGGIFVKQRCDKLIPGRHLFLEARFLRKPGQSDVDPRTGDYKAGQFESWTRFEIFEPGFRKQ